MSNYTKSTYVNFPFRRGTVLGTGLSVYSDPWPGYVGASETQTGYTNTFTGQKRPDWRKVIAKGGNATTPMTAQELHVSSRPATYHAFGNISLNNPIPANSARAKAYVALDTGAPVVMPSDTVDARAEDLARVKASRKIEEIMTSFQGGVFLGELRETLRMIRNPAQGLRRGLSSYLDALKKVRRGNSAQRLRNLQDTWLEYAFGWAPLLNDLDDARNLLAKRHRQLAQELLKFKAVGSDTRDLGHTFNSYGPGLTRTVQWHLHNKRTCIVVYSGAVSSKTTGPLISASAMGLSARAFVPTLWELLPWSFLVDYFTNIGDVLTAWSNINVDLAWCRHTTIKLLERKALGVRPPAVNWNHVYFEQFEPGEYMATLKHVARSPVDKVGPPGFLFELPGFGTKWLNLAALLKVGSRMRPF